MEDKSKKRSVKDHFSDKEKERKQMKEERDRYLAGWQRSQADFLNYKKEQAERFQKMVKYEKEKWILELLDALDLFERAEKTNQGAENPVVLAGFLQIKKYFEDFLKKHGVQEIVSEPDKKFNPRFEEVAETVEGEEEGIIAEVVRKGYQIGEKVIRPAKVKVSKKITITNNN